MKEYEKQFLYLLRCGVRGEKPEENYRFDVKNVFSLSEIHNVLPLVYDAAGKTAEDTRAYGRIALITAGMQTGRSFAFRELYGEMRDSGIDALVVKGPVCACLYSEPDNRISSDFDLIVPENQMAAAKEFLEAQGYTALGEAFKAKDKPYLEVHSSLSEEKGRFKEAAEKLFEGCFDRAVFQEGYKTLSCPDGMLYLIYHAFKHFTFGGFGVRQIMDIALYAERYYSEIDFPQLFKKLKSIRADLFALNVFYAAEKCFDFSFDFLRDEDESEFCFDDFVADLLSAGVFGQSTEDRAHSAGVVKNAVEEGEKSLKSSLFPPFAIMRARYKILKYLPILLPLFWLVRLVTYARKTVKKETSPLGSIKIAEDRIDIMKKMNIIK